MVRMRMRIRTDREVPTESGNREMSLREVIILHDVRFVNYRLVGRKSEVGSGELGVGELRRA